MLKEFPYEKRILLQKLFLENNVSNFMFLVEAIVNSITNAGEF